MCWISKRFPICVITGVLTSLVFLSASVQPQSSSQNGQLEGIVTDQSGSPISGCAVTASSTKLGIKRIALTDGSGIYRIPMLPLGIYSVSAEAEGYKKISRESLSIGAGQTLTIDLELPVGDIREEVVVSLEGAIADAGKTDNSRLIRANEVRDLPLPSRNPYDLTLLQPGVNGRMSRGFNFPTVNANGYARRVNYQIDGNNNTQADRAGVRLMLISEVYVSEVRLAVNAQAAEFGNTPGVIMNVISPSGTNDLSGHIGYRFRRPSFYSRPFFYPTTEPLPDNRSDDFTASLAGPMIKDRWHFYFGTEFVRRDDKAVAARLLTINEFDRRLLIAAGLAPAIFPPAIPSRESGPFYLFRIDAQLNRRNRVTARYNHSDLSAGNFIQGGLNTLERSVDTTSVDHAFSVQVVTALDRSLNEVRFQIARRQTTNLRNGNSGSGPSIVIAGVANFGSPDNAGIVNPRETSVQFQNNFTSSAGSHIIKAGGGSNFIADFKRSALFSRYSFPHINAYLAAVTGVDRYSYDRLEETFGDPEVRYRSSFWNAFVQDDWKVSGRLKLNLGVRYDLFVVPKADPEAPFEASRRFAVDKNNFAPRLGAAYLLTNKKRPTVLRFGAGMYYEAPWLNMYERALLRSGTPRFFNYRFLGNNGGTRERGPNSLPFPDTYSGRLPAGAPLPIQDIDTIAPEFENLYAMHTSLQLEQALTEDLSISVGYVRSSGRHIPVYRNINLGTPIRTLADGRYVYSNSARPDPRFNVIQMVEAGGVSEYNAMSLELRQRFTGGLQFYMGYTFSKAVDDAPEQNLTNQSVQNLVASDPVNRHLDRGRSAADQRHTFVFSVLLAPRVKTSNRPFSYLVNHNQFAILGYANSGETFNIVAAADLNGDGFSGSDRPLGVKRNSGTTPAQFNVDLRYSRSFRLTERKELRVFGEFRNLFNMNSIVQFNDVTVPVNLASGAMIGTLPDLKARNKSASQESRQFQLGVKFCF
jgi:hypothetical protein